MTNHKAEATYHGASITDRARAEAERRWPTRLRPQAPQQWLDEGMHCGFILGAQWAEGQPRTVTEADVERAARAACRAVWERVHGGSWDDDCPDKARWIREEREALLPALGSLGITVEGDQ